MAELKDMYKLVKYMDSEEFENIQTAVYPDKKTITLSGENELELFITEYAKKSKMRPKKIQQTFHNALSHDYLINVNAMLNESEGIEIAISKDGYHLIAKKCFIPVGLIDESLKAYDATKNVVISVLLSGAVSTIVAAGVAYFVSQ